MQKSKNIVVIGAGQGIGLKIAELMANEQNLTVFSRTKTDKLKNLEIIFHEFDILKDDFKDVDSPEQIHGLVYCPGSINLKPFNRISPSEFLEDFQINFMGAVKTVQHFLPALKKSRDASILFFSTVAAKVGMPFHTSIASSKGALEGLTISLAAELANYNIRVNAMAPSLTNTALSEKLLSSPEKIEASAGRHPLKRIGSPEEMAEMAAFLLSDKASWITGQIIGIDGGMGSIKN